MKHLCKKKNYKWQNGDNRALSVMRKVMTGNPLGLNWKGDFHLVIHVMIFFFSQPGCVNTTEMDIRKCRRLKNPQKVKKVREFSRIKNS